MDAIDIELFNTYAMLKADDHARAKHERATAGSTYARPVRSWCLVLRANDKRMEAHCAARTIRYHDWGEQYALCAVDEIELTADSVRGLCGPVSIEFPGVCIDEAARRFGVNRTTVHRWGKGRKSCRQQEMLGFARTEGRVVIDSECKGNGRDLHRAIKRVWTRRPIDPSGDVWAPPWGDATADLTHRVPKPWLQRVLRTHRPLGRRMVYVRLLQCPTCIKWCYKLYWPQRIWTVAEAAGDRGRSARGQDGFMCRRCARVIYESAERGSRPAAGRRVNMKVRFTRRALGAIE